MALSFDDLLSSTSSQPAPVTPPANDPTPEYV